MGIQPDEVTKSTQFRRGFEESRPAPDSPAIGSIVQYYTFNGRGPLAAIVIALHFDTTTVDLQVFQVGNSTGQVLAVRHGWGGPHTWRWPS